MKYNNVFRLGRCRRKNFVFFVNYNSVTIGFINLTIKNKNDTNNSVINKLPNLQHQKLKQVRKKRTCVTLRLSINIIGTNTLD